MKTDPDASTAGLLRDLDAADRELSHAQRRGAAVTLERIVATDPRVPVTVGAPDRAPRRRARLLLVAGGVVAAVAAVVVVPTITGDTRAFATWSPTPVELQGAERATALEACLVLQSGDDGDLALDAGARASALVAEARGGWDYVLFTATGSSGRELRGSCLAPHELIADPRPHQGGFFGGLEGAEEAVEPLRARDDVHLDTFGVGSIDGDVFAYAEGRAGADVAGIQVTSPGGLRIDASLDDGRWAAWWPAGDDSPGSPGTSDAPTFTVTLRDGTVLSDVSTGD